MDSVLGGSRQGQGGSEEMDEDGEVSYDDIIEEGNGETWFGMRMTKEEKIEARRPWRNSLIIKLIRRNIRYHYLWKHIQAMWRTRTEPLLIDLSNNFFIVKLYGREEYKRALLDIPWMICENYLHVQR